MANLLPERCNNIVLGDFNLHASNDEDINSAIFNDTTEAMGVYQHVSFPTHRSGNTLDLIISELQSPVTINTTVQEPFITNHCAIISTLSIKKPQPKRAVREVRKLHKVTTEDWIKNLTQTMLNLALI